VEGHFCFSVQAVYSAKKENILQSLLLTDILTVKRKILSAIPSTNTFLEVCSKKDGARRGKVIAEKYFMFISIMQLGQQIGS